MTDEDWLANGQTEDSGTADHALIMTISRCGSRGQSTVVPPPERVLL